MRILGIDLGIASLGWGLIEIDPEKTENNKIVGAGVRIFDRAEHHKDGSSLAEPRRTARSRRRTLRRKKGRLKTIKELFSDTLKLREEEVFEIEDSGAGSIYKEKKKTDVWQLRDEALHRKLEPKELLRVLTHIAKRRGYFSNSKEDHGDNVEGKKVLEAISENQKMMAKNNYLTVGQMLYRETQKEDLGKGLFPRIRNTNDDYRHCVTREMLLSEVDVIYEHQKKFSGNFSKLLKNNFIEVAFYQRPIKSVEDMVGYCTFEKQEKRAPKRAYSSEVFVALGKIHNTTVIENHREKKLVDFYPIEDILEIFHNTKEVKYKTLRKALQIPESIKFKNVNYKENCENKTLSPIDKFFEKETWLSEKQKEALFFISDKGVQLFNRGLRRYSDVRRRLEIDEEQKFVCLASDYKKDPEDVKIYSMVGYHELKKLLSGELFSKLTKNLNLYNDVATVLTYEKDIDKIKDRLNDLFRQAKLEQNDFEEIDSLLTTTVFKEFINLSIIALDKLNPLLKQGKRFEEACLEIYGHHSKFEGEKRKLLRALNREENWQLTNPVTKRAFAQFRKVVNAVIRKYGQFDSMHIELARELKHSLRQRKEIEFGQREFKEGKEAAHHRFIELCKREPNSRELLKMRLWEEQSGRCVYSQNPISIENLIKEPKYCEIDHVLPHSRTFDDSLNNKVLVFSQQNQEKKNRTPFEWIAGGDESNPQWEQFKLFIYGLKNLKNAKRNKLFNTTLTSRHGKELTEENVEKDHFINRNLNDTQFMARFVKNFVEQNLEFKDNSQIKQKVKVRTGMLTSHLRYVWGLGAKSRDTHLHHAVDALVVAASTQSEVQRMSTYAARYENYQFANTQEKKQIKELKSTDPFSFDQTRPSQIDEFVNNIFPSFAPRRKVKGAAHEETLYSGKTFKKKNRGGETKELKGSSRQFPVVLNDGKALAIKESMPRIDLFQNVDDKKYYIVPVYVADFVKKRLPNLAIVQGKDKDGNKKPWLPMDESYEFITSIYKNDLIEVDTGKKRVLGYFSSAQSGSGVIAIKNPRGKSDENIKNKKGEDEGLIVQSMGIQRAKSIKKFEVSPLGEITEVKLPQKRVGTVHELRDIKKHSRKNR